MTEIEKVVLRIVGEHARSRGCEKEVELEDRLSSLGFDSLSIAALEGGIEGAMRIGRGRLVIVHNGWTVRDVAEAVKIVIYE